MLTIGRSVLIAAILVLFLALGGRGIATAQPDGEASAPPAAPAGPALETPEAGAQAASVLAATSDASAAQPAAEPFPSPPGPAGLNPEDVTIYVIVGYFHSDIVIPRSAFANAPALLKSAADKAPDGSWIIVGWGPWWFGRDVKGAPFHAPPIRMTMGVWTLLVPQTHSQVRVAAVDVPGAAPGEHYMLARPIRLSPADLERLMKRIDRSFAVGRDGGLIPENRKGVAEGVAIYRSKEIYHLTHQCNHWLGEVLRAGGVNTSWILDLLPASLYLDLKMNGAIAPPDHTPAPESAPTG